MRGKINLAKLLLRVFYSIFVLLIVGCLYFIVFKDFYLRLESIESLYEISITISSILFGVLGIWVSIVYADSFSSFIKGSSNERRSSIANIKVLFKPLFYSILCILLGVLFFIVDFQVRENCPDCYLHKDIFLKVGLVIYLLITLVQFWYIISIFRPLIELIFNLETQDEEASVKDQFLKRKK